MALFANITFCTVPVTKTYIVMSFLKYENLHLQRNYRQPFNLCDAFLRKSCNDSGTNLRKRKQFCALVNVSEE